MIGNKQLQMCRKAEREQKINKTRKSQDIEKKQANRSKLY